MCTINIKNKIFAHRGMHNNLNIPENSMKSFKRSLDKNIPIELDIHLTKDNKLVVFHDNNLKRMTGVNKLIRKCSYEELIKLKLLDTDEAIPLFIDVLNLINGKVLINIEVKDDKRLQTTVELLLNILDNYKGPFIIQSFYFRYLLLIKKKRKNYITGILVTNIKKFCYKIMYFKFITSIIKPDFIACNKNMIMCNSVKKLRNKGYIIIAWTIKNKKEKKNAYKYADSLISEYLYDVNIYN